MQIHWKHTLTNQIPIGTLTYYDGGCYKLFVSEATGGFSFCYKVNKTESIDEHHLIDSAELMPEDWVPFHLVSSEDYPLYSIKPSLQFGSWTLKQEDSQSLSPLPSSLPQEQQRPTSHQPSHQVSVQKPLPNSPEVPQTRPYAKQARPSSQSHPKSHQHHSKQQRPALKHTNSSSKERMGESSSNSTSHVKHQSQHQLQKGQQNGQLVLNGQISSQSQWIPLETLSLSPSSQSSPKQKVKQPRQGHASVHHSTGSKHSHVQPTSHQQKPKRQRQHHEPVSKEVNLPQQPKN